MLAADDLLAARDGLSFHRGRYLKAALAEEQLVDELTLDFGHFGVG